MKAKIIRKIIWQNNSSIIIKKTTLLNYLSQYNLASTDWYNS